jgi:aspartate kinase
MSSGIIVQKYGGSSVADVDKIKRVAARIVKVKDQGKSLIVVVSAVADTTDRLLKQAFSLHHNPPKRELDMLLSTGEQISIALLSMAIQNLGYKAISFTGAQVGILTDSSFTKAKIVDLDPSRILQELDKDKIVIVAGFQGVTSNHDITTLGRGGSDTTAVALAASLKAEKCQIFTDVDGVYTADPKIVPKARKLASISYEEMLEMSASGAKIMQLRSVEYGRKYSIVLEVRSSFTDKPGTIIGGDEKILEKAVVSGVTCDDSEAKITIFGVPDRPGIAASIFQPLAEANINVDMIIQNVSEKGITDVSFTVPQKDLVIGKQIIEKVVDKLSARGLAFDERVAKVSLIGAGMKSHPGVAAKMFSILAKENINIEMISTSTIKVSCVIRIEDVEKAVKALHQGFRLDKAGD